MSYVFLKKPYGIISEENEVQIYNYLTQSIEKTYRFAEKVPKGFLSRVAMYQITDAEKLLAESTDFEKSFIAKLVKDNTYVHVVNEITEDISQTETIMYEADKIGMNYANSNEKNVRYKVYKHLKDNMEKIRIVIIGSGIISNRLEEELKSLPLKEIIHVEDWNEFKESDDGDSQVHCIYVNDRNDIDKLYDFGRDMAEGKRAWSLLAVSSDNLIIGPTFYPGQVGCVKCGFDKEFFENKYNPTSYEASIMAGIFVSDLSKIIGDMPDAIVEDISVTIGRAFCINRKSLDGESINLKYDSNCDICGIGK